MDNTFSYRAYGLGFRAPMPLPELVGGEAETEVSIRFGRVEPPPVKHSAKNWGYYNLGPEEDHLFWQEVGSFLVRAGCEIVVDPRPGLDEQVLRLFLLGPVLAVLLHQRGHLLLHASAVAVNDEAVLFLGSAGWGKSTIAAALHARGHNLVTDDLAVLRVEESRPMLFPGFPQLKLWPEALVSLGDNPEKLPRCNPHLEKRARSATHRFSSRSLPVKQIYVLGEGNTTEILPLRPQEALGELVRHTYGALGVGSTSHFLKCVSMVDRVRTYRLRRQKTLAQLPNLAQLIEENVNQDTYPSVLDAY
jgi:hypothetical protein